MLGSWLYFIFLIMARCAFSTRRRGWGIAEDRSYSTTELRHGEIAACFAFGQVRDHRCRNRSWCRMLTCAIQKMSSVGQPVQEPQHCFNKFHMGMSSCTDDAGNNIPCRSLLRLDRMQVINNHVQVQDKDVSIFFLYHVTSHTLRSSAVSILKLNCSR